MKAETRAGLRLSTRLAAARGAMKLTRAWKLPGREQAYRAWYDAISEFSELLFADFHCMNYGVAPVADPDAHEAFQLGLYDLLAGFEPLAGCRVLEVGSGRGGGAAHVGRTHGARAVEGLDLSARAVEMSRAAFEAPGLRFTVGAADRLPFEDASFDVLLNVESSHCYPDVEAFLGEARRVLTPDGALLLADFRHRDEAADLRDQAERAGFRVSHEEEITKRVIDALDADDARKRRLIDACPAVPSAVRGSIRHFAGCKGSPMYEDFRAGRRVYLAYRMAPALV